MFLNLLIRKFEDLQTVRISRLRGFCLCEIVDHSLIREGLLDILICEKHYQIAVREGLSSDSISENDFFLA
jgi:hypothetical protein